MILGTIHRVVDTFDGNTEIMPEQLADMGPALLRKAAVEFATMVFLTPGHDIHGTAKVCNCTVVTSTIAPRWRAQDRFRYIVTI